MIKRWLCLTSLAFLIAAICAGPAAAADKVQPSVEKKTYTGQFPVGGEYLGKDEGLEKVILQKMTAAVRKDSRKELSAEEKKQMGAMATQLWKEALSVLRTSEKEVQAQDTNGVESILQSKSAWDAAELTDFGWLEFNQDWMSSSLTGWVVVFKQGELVWKIQACSGECDSLDCYALLIKGKHRLLGYAPSRGEQGPRQLLYLPGGVVDFSESEDEGITVETKFPQGYQKAENDGTPAVKTSSELDAKHTAGLLVDNSISTAWAEGKPDAGAGEWIELTWTQPRRIKSIEIFPGFGKSRALFYANNRVKRAKITLSNGSKFVAALEDKPAVQHFDFGTRTVGLRPLIGQEGKETIAGEEVPSPWEEQKASWDFPAVSSARMEILEVYPGEKFNDTCISEIELGFADQMNPLN